MNLGVNIYIVVRLHTIYGQLKKIQHQYHTFEI